MKKKKYLASAIVAILAVTFIVSLILLVVLNSKIQTEIFWNNQQEKIVLITRDCADRINTWAENYSVTLKSLSDEISSGKFISEENYEDYLDLLVRKDPEIQAAYIALDNGINYFSDDFVVPEEDDQDFYYWQKICNEANGKIIFTEPYLDMLTNGIVISCMQSIVLPNGISGIAAIDISLETMIAKVDALSPSQNGGAYVLSSQYKVMTYYVDPSFLPKIISENVGPNAVDLNETFSNEEKTPKYIIQGNMAFLNADWVFEQVNVFKNIDRYDETDGVHIQHVNDYDGVEKYEATMVMPATGWVLGVNIPINDYDTAVNKVIKDQVPIIFLAVLMSIISISIALIMIHNAKQRNILQKNIEIAQTANKTKSSFLSRMSHEMRTPMNAIIGMAKIADNTNDISKLRYCLSTIETSSVHLLGIINDILDMSKIEAGKLELYNVPMNIEKMLMKVCNLIVDKTEQKSQIFDITLGKNMELDYIGDDLRLSQIVANLLSNAVKFTPEKGKISLMVDEVEKEGNIGVVRFTVTDTGIGMTKEQVGKLFNSFEQTDNRISRQFGGTGLGLAIAKNIIEKMDGRIWVESEPGEGSAFTFEVKLERIAKQESAVIFDGISPSDLKILVVDDDAAIREHFKSITERFGIHTEEADSGKKAIYLAEEAMETKRAYDVIFVDYDMAEMDGIETIRNLNAKIDKNTVIIMTSFLTWNKIEKEASGVGVKRFISKPLFPSAILDTINEVVGRTAKDLDIKTSNIRELMDFSDVNILLVEDVEINREIVIALLENTKINIETAENGLIAVQKFKENQDKYDMIVMDVQMPEMDGYEATRAIRDMNTVKSKSIPIIAMTANAFKEDIDLCLNSGMNDHISKPIDENILVEKINHYLNMNTEQFSQDIALSAGQ